MNYQIRLVAGDGADFFLEDWKPGGVPIAPDFVGLFDAFLGRPQKERELLEELEAYGLRAVDFKLPQLIKVGLADAWTWRTIRWPNEPGSAPLLRAVRRIEELLAGPIREDVERQVALLKLVQATARREGEPVRIEGTFPRPGGKEEPIFVYRAGVVAYDRTPHPLPFLRAIASALIQRSRPVR